MTMSDQKFETFHMSIALILAIIGKVWSRRRAVARFRRRYLGAHWIKQGTYYGNSAYTIIMRLRQERGLAY
jgi:hypothetical protein